MGVELVAVTFSVLVFSTTSLEATLNIKIAWIRDGDQVGAKKGQNHL
jgi:hypothetical protein